MSRSLTPHELNFNRSQLVARMHLGARVWGARIGVAVDWSTRH
jgi:hypothetical protein